MRKIILATFLSLATFWFVAAQDTNFFQQQKKDTARFHSSGDITINGDDIRRFPSTSFMDAVNGLFPWVFSPRPDPNDFLFVVNGYLFTDIDGMSLNDIEDVRFTRHNLHGGLFPFSKAGIFFIRTKQAAKGGLQVHFNTQYNIAWNKERFAPPGSFGLRYTDYTTDNRSSNRPGHLSSHHLSLGKRGEKLGFNFSAQLNTSRPTEIRQYTQVKTTSGPPGYADTIESTTVVKAPDQRLWANLTYKLCDKLDAGITGGYSRNRTDLDTASQLRFYYGGDTTVFNSLTKTDFYLAGGYINYRPLRNLINTFSVEHAYNEMKSEGTRTSYYVAFSGPPSNISENTGRHADSKRFVIRDQLKYSFLQRSKFTADVSFTFMHMWRQVSMSENRVVTRNGSLMGTSGFWYRIEEKAASLNPALHFSWNRIVSGYAGVARLIGKKNFENIQDKDKYNFYSGLHLDFSELLPGKKAPIHPGLSFTYANTGRNNSNDQWLSSSNMPGQFSPVSHFEWIHVSSNPFRAGIAKNELISIRLYAGFRGNRYQFISEWSRLKKEDNYIVQVGGFPGSPVFYVAIPGTEEQKGLSFALIGKLIDKTPLSLRTSLNVLLPDTKLEQAATQSGITPYESAARIGMQNRLDYKKFFFQLNALYDMDRVHYRYDPNTLRYLSEKQNDFNLNYIILGYGLATTAGRTIKSVTVFAQARNVVVSKKLKDAFNYDHYAGLGVNIDF